MKLVVNLDEIGDGDGSRVGGKAVALAALRRRGTTVPATLCLTTEAYDIFVEEGSLRPVIHQELGRKKFADMRWEEVWDTALRIRNRFLRAPFPEAVAAEIEARLSEALGDGPLAVRSSAPGEDTEESSFAGLHDSYVGVRRLPAVLDAVRGVWASLWTDRALIYRRELGIDVDTSAMAVVIQELVEGRVSGIAFGVHPTDRELIAVEAVYGLNQGLVDGTIEPDRWALARVGGRVVDHVPPSRRRRLVVADAGTVVEDVPPDLAETPPLEVSGLREVFEAVTASEAVFGLPQDIEWTVAGDRLVLLQSRAITTSQTKEGDQRAWYLSLTRSLDNLRGVRDRVERELLPKMEAEATELARCDLSSLDDEALAHEIESRLAAHDRWVDVYWKEFIPLAHGIRLFGQFFNETVRPEDPYEFMNLLAATPMMSVRRNRELARLASLIRDDSELRRKLEAGGEGDGVFEQQVEAFHRTFGDAVFADQQCFGERDRLVRLLLSLVEAPVVEAATSEDVEALAETFLSSVDADRHELAAELLELGRISYRLRDDDNIYLGRFEGLVLNAVEEGRSRLHQNSGGRRLPDLQDVVQGLRHPNLVVEAKEPPRPIKVERGFRAVPRQLVGQPAGPGVATAAARVVERVDDLFLFRAGEVLVCDAVDPNMTFVVPMASAVVERRGGMLIHGAIIAREYGLPCVTGVPEATSLIATGDQLTVDGYLGIITVSREPGPTTSRVPEPS